MADMITLEFDGTDKFKKQMEKLQKDARTRLNRQINVNALDFQRSVRKSIRQKSGRYRQYRRGKTQVAKGKKRIHYSSMPGSAPNSDTGNLVKRIMVTRPAFGQNTYATVVSGAKYSAWLEKGTGRMRARPFFEVMLRKKQKVFVSRMKQAIKGLL